MTIKRKKWRHWSKVTRKAKDPTKLGKGEDILSSGTYVIGRHLKAEAMAERWRPFHDNPLY